MKKNFLAIGLILALCSCGNETILSDDLSVKLFVEVGAQPLSKTLTEADGDVTFVNNDKVGLFTEGRENPVLWTYLESAWTSSENVKWDNRTDDFEFYAYYPCEQVSGVTRTSVPMPDLSVQSGNINDIGKNDFLVGSCVSSYSDNSGVVSFSDENSFSHVYSLLYLNIVTGDEGSGVSFSECTFSGTGIVTPHTYSLDISDGGMKKSGDEEKSELKITGLSSVSPIAVLINPVSLEEPLRFTLKYTRDGMMYEASAGLGNSFGSGSLNKITLKIVDGKLLVSGNDVLDWNIVTLDEIILDGSPV